MHLQGQGNGTFTTDLSTLAPLAPQGPHLFDGTCTGLPYIELGEGGISYTAHVPNKANTRLATVRDDGFIIVNPPPPHPTPQDPTRPRRIAALVAGFVADAAAMPLHWIYDTAEIASITARLNRTASPEFVTPSFAPFYSYPVGDFTPFGAHTAALPTCTGLTLGGRGADAGVCAILGR